ncbi:MAG: glycosyltransferase family 4 protein [Bacteroidota bacterium]
MRFTVFTHVNHIKSEKSIYAYSPYVREMKLWFSKADEVEIVAPITSGNRDSISIPYQNEDLIFTAIPSFDLLSLKSSLQAIFKIPLIGYKVFVGMFRSDHIHLRCPGNIGLIACFVQILFPKKSKTVKYAGNWDPNAIQPWSYRLQKRILSNTFLTRNMTVLVYGNWPEQSKNILPFFTASFAEAEKSEIHKEFNSPYKLMFVGSLVPGKNPFFAIQLVESLMGNGIPVKLEFYGDGSLKKELKAFIETKNLGPFVCLMGNQKEEILKEAYKNSHFLVLASKSEGWPKAVAEAMFFGCIPIATAVSCVPWMLNYGDRGIIIPTKENRKENKEKRPVEKSGEKSVESQDVINDTADRVIELIKNPEEMKKMSMEVQEWSQEYTLERFENAIKMVLAPLPMVRDPKGEQKSGL